MRTQWTESWNLEYFSGLSAWFLCFIPLFYFPDSVNCNFQRRQKNLMTPGQNTERRRLAIPSFLGNFIQNNEQYLNFTLTLAGSVVVDYVILPGNDLETTMSKAWFLMQDEVENGRFKLIYNDNGTEREITAVPQSFKQQAIDIPGDQCKYEGTHPVQSIFRWPHFPWGKIFLCYTKEMNSEGRCETGSCWTNFVVTCVNVFVLCNIPVRPNVPVHKWSTHSCMSPGLCNTSLSMYCTTQWVYSNGASVYICSYGEVEYYNPDCYTSASDFSWKQCIWKL